MRITSCAWVLYFEQPSERHFLLLTSKDLKASKIASYAVIIVVSSTKIIKYIFFYGNLSSVTAGLPLMRKAKIRPENNDDPN